MTLPELLVVVSLLGMAVLIAVPLVAEKLHRMRVERAASEIRTTYVAARSIAVTRSAVVPVIVGVDPENLVRYTDAAGVERILRMPQGVRITSSDSPILFNPDGSAEAAAQTEIEAEIGGQTRLWTVTVAISGVPRVAP